MDQFDNLRQIAYCFAVILKSAIESESIRDSGRLVFDWDDGSIDCRYTKYTGNDVEEGDINA